MIIQENITVYKCEFCKKKYVRKHACEKHENFCPANPKNEKACSGCIFLEEIKIEYYSDYCGREIKVTSNGFKCTKKDQLLYPLKTERLDLPNRFPETFEGQKPMPKECEFQDYGIDFDFN